MINEEIKSVEVRLVQGSESNVISTKEAIEIAEKEGLDLVCINDKVEIPIVIIEDYGKYCYEKLKKEKENKKKARENKQDLKEIQITESTALNDLRTKAKNIDRILKDGDKARLSIRYKGRTIRNISGGPEKLNSLIALITVPFNIDRPIKIEGNTVSTIVTPIKK